MTCVGASRQAVSIDPETDQRPRLEISIANGLSLAVSGVLVPLSNRRARAILAYLVLERASSVPRDRLATLFWSESSERHARNSLRQTLFELRDALSDRGCDVLRADREDVRLLHDDIRLDLDLALEAIASGIVPESFAAGTLGAGQMLAGYEDLSAEFGDWVEATRRYAHGRLMRALETRFASGALPGEIRWRMAEMALRLDPLHEGACRTFMRLAVDAGEIGIALRAYADLYEAMDRQLDMEPSEVTQALVADIKLGRLNSNPSDQPVAPAAASGSLGFGHAPLVAVLPFQQMGARIPNHQVDGLAGDIVCQLAGLRDLGVISFGSTLRPRDGELDARAFGRTLNARFVVSGTIRRTGQGLRLAIDLADTESGIVLWARSFDTGPAISFEDQDRVVAAIVNTLAPRVREVELRRIRGKRPESLTVYERIVVARELMSTYELPEYEAARRLLDEAIAAEPDYAEPYALLSDWHSRALNEGWSRDRAADVAAVERSARTALRLDGDNVRALTLHGHRKSLLHRDYTSAQESFRRALEVAPSWAQTWAWSSYTYSYIGDTDEALRRAHRALTLSPRDRHAHDFYSVLCVAHYTAGDYSEATEWGLRALEETPVLRATFRWTAASLLASGQAARAREIMRMGMEQMPNQSVREVVRLSPYRDSVRRDQLGSHLIAAGFPD